MINTIHSDMIRGHIDTIILSILKDGDRYGYDIMGEIQKKSGGEYTLKQPTLYSCLKRLESQGFIYKYWGTETNGGRRTYYSLTEMGKELFKKNQDEWNYSRSIIDKLISDNQPSSQIYQNNSPVSTLSENNQPVDDISEVLDAEIIDGNYINSDNADTATINSDNEAVNQNLQDDSVSQTVNADIHASYQPENFTYICDVETSFEKDNNDIQSNAEASNNLTEQQPIIVDSTFKETENSDYNTQNNKYFSENLNESDAANIHNETTEYKNIDENSVATDNDILHTIDDSEEYNKNHFETGNSYNYSQSSYTQETDEHTSTLNNYKTYDKYSDSENIVEDYIKNSDGLSYADRMNETPIDSDYDVIYEESSPASDKFQPFNEYSHASKTNFTQKSYSDYSSYSRDYNNREDYNNSESNIYSRDEDFPYPKRAFYSENDFENEEPLAVHKESTLKNNQESKNEENTHESMFRRYNDEDNLDEINRKIIIKREYRAVIRELLNYDFDEPDNELYTYDNHQNDLLSDRDRDRDFNEYSEQAYNETDRYYDPMTATQEPGDIDAESAAAFDETMVDDDSFDDLFVSVRSMGDEVRIRSHNNEIERDYDSLYHYYSTKLNLFKYGIIYGLMILEIIVPYLIFKLGFNLGPLYGELPFMIIFTVLATALPIYSVIAYIADPYKKKRYDFSLRTSLLYRFGIMFLVLILIYSMNVVLYMDISFSIEYIFSLVTPALMSTNIPLSAILFKALYSSKKFNAD